MKFTDYITINISSPNTPGLRSFENKEIDDLLNELSRNRQNDKSIFIKISPDLEKNDLEQSVNKILNYGMDGIVLTNTSISRPQHLQSKFSSEKVSFFDIENGVFTDAPTSSSYFKGQVV